MKDWLIDTCVFFGANVAYAAYFHFLAGFGPLQAFSLAGVISALVLQRAKR